MEIATLLDADQACTRLRARGMSASGAAVVADSLLLVGRAFARLVDEEGRELSGHFVPGRVEVLGKHTDYCGGRSLVGALERGFCVVAAARPDLVVRVVDARRGDEWVRSLERSGPGPESYGSTYFDAVLRRLERNFPGALRGADIVFASDLPDAAGLSSSSALIVALYLALADVCRLRDRAEYGAAIRDARDRAAYLAAVESGASFRGLTGETGVGTEGGSEDHAAILLSTPGRLTRFEYLPLRREGTVDVPADLVFAIGSSGVRAEKTGAAQDRYNRLSRLARAIVEAARGKSQGEDPTLAQLARRDGADGIRQRLAAASGGPFETGELRDRLEHFLLESEELVVAATAALERGDLSRFGKLVGRSVEEGARLLQNQVPETLALARSARALGAIAASPFGAGFGGSVWALVSADGAERFLSEWREQHAREYLAAASRSEFLLSRAGPAAFEL